MVRGQDFTAIAISRNFTHTQVNVGIAGQGRAVRRRVGPAQADGGELGHRVDVDGVRDGAAQVGVGQGRVVRPHQQHVPRQQLLILKRQVGAAARALDHVGRQCRHQVGLAHLHGGDGHGGVGDDQEPQVAGDRVAAAGIAVLIAAARPVAVEPFQQDVFALAPLGQPIGAGADRRAPGAVVIQRAGVQDAQVALGVGQRGQEDRRGLGQGQVDGVAVHDGHRHDAGADRRAAVEQVRAAVPSGRVQQAVVAPFDLLGGHLRAVVEPHAPAQVEAVGAPVVQDRVALGQHRRHRQVLAEGDQAFDDVVHHRVGVAVAVDAHVGAADVGIEHDADFLVRPAHRAVGGRLADGRQRRHHRHDNGAEPVSRHRKHTPHRRWCPRAATGRSTSFPGPRS